MTATKDEPKFYPYDEYLKLKKNPSLWIIDGFLPLGFTTCYAKPKIGKALTVDTPIMTPSGWRTIGEIKTGDQVFGANGKPVKVLAVSPVWHNRPTYRVTFLDNTHIDADENHEWKVLLRNNNRPTNVKTTRELYENGVTNKSGRYRKYMYAIQLTEALELSEQTLPIDPYCFGMWLGDGTTVNGQFTTADTELTEEWKKAGYVVRKQPSNKYGYGILGLKKQLQSLGVLGNKHVPKEYLNGTRSQRHALLQGLMDTDGTASKTGIAEFNNTNINLSQSVIWLARSLGYRAVWCPRNVKFQGKIYKDYRVRIFAHEPVFRLARKAKRQNINVTDRVWSIKSIEYIGLRATVCIQVDATDHLFLAGENLIPTHNSFLMISITEAIVNGDPEWQGFPISQHGNVMYLQVDTPRELWSSLYMEPMKIQDRKHELYCADMWTVPTYPFNLVQQKKDATLFDKAGNPITDPEWLEKEITKANPILIIVDTFRESHNEDEDKSGPMKLVMSALQKAAGQGRAIVIISHAKKDSPFTTNSEEDMMDQNRGSTYLMGKMDMIIRMTPKEIHWKGRAIGYKKIRYERDNRGFILLLRDNEEEKTQTHEILNLLNSNNPNISKNQLAIKLAALTKISERTAHRRIDEWKTQTEASKKMTQSEQEILKSKEMLAVQDLQKTKMV